MKKQVLGLTAVLLAVAFSAFTTTNKLTAKIFQTRYAVYTSTTGTNPEKIAGNYSVQMEAPDPCQGSNTLCWIEFNDANNDDILDQSELNSFFSTRDSNSDNQLSDESETSVFPALQKQQ